MDFNEKDVRDSERRDFSKFLTALATVLMVVGTAWIVFSMLGCTPY